MIKLINPEKIFWQQQKISKKDLFDYYDKISSRILPYLKNRPTILKRCPNGVSKECWVQQHAPENIPSFIRTFKHKTISDPHEIKHLIINNKDSLLWLINQGVIEIHVWNNPYNLKTPEEIVFDIDREKQNLDKIKTVCFKIKEFSEKEGYKPYLKTTGLSGFHIILKNKHKFNYQKIRKFVKQIINDINSKKEIITYSARKEKRGNLIYVDPAQNSYGRSIVAPYSVRAYKKFSISLPLKWNELKSFKYQPLKIVQYIKKIQSSKKWI